MGSIIVFHVSYYNILSNYLIYRHTDPPYIIAEGYINHIDDQTTDALVTVYCNTRDYPPTIIWRRNGIEILIDGSKYKAHQKVTDLYESYYHNTLIIRDISGITNRPVYTCEVRNAAGSNEWLIHLDTINVRVFLSISGKPLLYG